MPVGSEEVTEMVDFWLVKIGGTSTAAGLSASSSPSDSLRERSKTFLIPSLRVTETFDVCTQGRSQMSKEK